MIYIEYDKQVHIDSNGQCLFFFKPTLHLDILVPRISFFRANIVVPIDQNSFLVKPIILPL
jgi:hypothetical protein